MADTSKQGTNYNEKFKQFSMKPPCIFSTDSQILL